MADFFWRFHNCWAKVTIDTGLIINQPSQFIEIFSSEEIRVTEVNNWSSEVAGSAFLQESRSARVIWKANVAAFIFSRPVPITHKRRVCLFGCGGHLPSEMLCFVLSAALLAAKDHQPVSRFESKLKAGGMTVRPSRSIQQKAWANTNVYTPRIIIFHLKPSWGLKRSRVTHKDTHTRTRTHTHAHTRAFLNSRCFNLKAQFKNKDKSWCALFIQLCDGACKCNIMNPKKFKHSVGTLLTCNRARRMHALESNWFFGGWTLPTDRPFFFYLAVENVCLSLTQLLAERETLTNLCTYQPPPSGHRYLIQRAFRTVSELS